MRDIKFRGKLINSGKWSEGNLIIRKGNNAEIMACTSPDATPIGTYGRINVNTIGQYPGLKDKNGKEIYERDIVKFRFKKDRPECPDLIGFIEYQSQYCAFKIVSSPEIGAFRIDDEAIIEVIGNVWDNPELLEN